jgi:type IV secretion system protein VirD4
MATSQTYKRNYILTVIAVFFVISFMTCFGVNADGLNSFITFLLALIFVIVKMKWKIKALQFNSPINPNDARWSTEEEFVSIIRPDPNKTEGVWLGGDFICSKNVHGVVIGGAGTGKTASHLIPNLLIKPYSSIFSLDIKGELSQITAAAQKAMGQEVYIIDPFDVQTSLRARHGIKSSGFNPFIFLTDENELIENCNIIAQSLIPDKPNDKDPYWRERSRQMLVCVLAHIATALPEKERNMYELFKILRASGDDWTNHLLAMKKNKSLDGLISIAAEEFLGLVDSEATLASIRSNAQQATALFASPQLRNNLSKNDFNPYDLSAKGNLTVYLILPERFVDVYDGWARMVIALSLKACNAKPANPVQFFFDEFPILKKFDDAKRNFAFGRGQNIRLWIYAQSIASLREIYGDDGMNVFLSNAGVLQCIGGARDLATREYFSKILGNKTRIKEQYSTSFTEGKETSTSNSTAYVEEKTPLLTPEQIGNMTGIITLCDRGKVVLENTPYFKNRYEGVSLDATWLTKEERQILKLGKLPVDTTHEYFMKMAEQPDRIA